MIAGCAFHVGVARFVTRAYCRYIKFLEEAGADSRAVRGRLLVDAEQILGDLFDCSIDEIYPEYPIETSATEEIRRLVSEKPGLPIVIYAGPEGVPGAYADIKSVGVIDFLNCDPPRTAPATLVTNRERLASMLREEYEARCLLDGNMEVSDGQVDDWVKRRLEEYEPAWTQAICINVTWKDLHSDFMI